MCPRTGLERVGLTAAVAGVGGTGISGFVLGSIGSESWTSDEVDSVLVIDARLVASDGRVLSGDFAWLKVGLAVVDDWHNDGISSGSSVAIELVFPLVDDRTEGELLISLLATRDFVSYASVWPSAQSRMRLRVGGRKGSSAVSCRDSCQL